MIVWSDKYNSDTDIFFVSFVQMSIYVLKSSLNYNKFRRRTDQDFKEWMKRAELSLSTSSSLLYPSFAVQNLGVIFDSTLYKTWNSNFLGMLVSPQKHPTALLYSGLGFAENTNA